MKSKIRLVALAPILIFFCLILTGCPYESDVPLDSTPQIKINKDYLGLWKRNKNGRDSTWVKMEQKSENEYSISAFLFDDMTSKYEKSNYTGYLSLIENFNVLNLKDDNAENFYYVVITLQDGKLNLLPFSDDIKDVFQTSEAAKTFFTNELRKPVEKIRYDEDNSILNLKKSE